jgi:hypothetical protein
MTIRYLEFGSIGFDKTLGGFFESPENQIYFA